ncbi:MAG: alpha-L-rhamnosidase C-terminal domain-containing protein [bacterium]
MTLSHIAILTLSTLTLSAGEADFVVATTKAQMKKYLAPSVLQATKVQPKNIEKKADGWRIVFAKQVVGDLRLSFRVTTATTPLIVHYGESAQEADPQVNWDLGWCWKQIDTGVLTPQETVFDTTTMKPPKRAFGNPRRRAFSHVSVVVDPAQVELVEAEATLRHFALPKQGSFACNDAAMNRIWDISQHTTRLCMQQFYEDGVKRDQMLWQGDAVVGYLCNVLLFADHELCRKSLAMLAMKQRGDGFIPPPSEGFATYHDDWLNSLRDFYLHSGDGAGAREFWPIARLALDWTMTKHHGNGLVDLKGDGWWSTANWSQVWRRNTVVAGRELARAVGDKETETRCAAYLEKADPILMQVKDLNRYETAAYVLGDLFSPAEGRRRFQELAQRKNLQPERVGYAKMWIWMAMMRCGLIDESLADMRTWYKDMLDTGSSTAWELGDLIQTRTKPPLSFATSRCHIWSAGPAYCLPRFVLGVEPVQPGFTEVRIRPQLGALQWAEGTIPTVAGEIRLRWERADNTRLRGRIQLPLGIRGRLELPGQNRELSPGENVVE